MFMRNNRRKNGVKQPEVTTRDDARQQEQQATILPNKPVPPGQKRTFTPALMTPESINNEFVHRYENDDVDAPYEAHIPNGPKMDQNAPPGASNMKLRPMGKRGKR